MAAAEIAQAMLAKENAQIETDLEALWKGISKKYKEACKGCMIAGNATINIVQKQELYQQECLAFKCAAHYVRDEEKWKLCKQVREALPYDISRSLPNIYKIYTSDSDL